jgi:molybdopterin converting factor small subunit
MQVSIRLSPGLAQLAGNPRLSLALEEGATVADLLLRLRNQHPALDESLSGAVAVISGRHAAQDEALHSGEEVALLLPISGGCGFEL